MAAETVGTITGDASSSSIPVGKSGAGAIPGGSVSVYVWSSSWNSATATLQGSPDGTTWIDLTDSSGSSVALTANGVRVIELHHGFVRVTVSGSGSPEPTISYSFNAN